MERHADNDNAKMDKRFKNTILNVAVLSFVPVSFPNETPERTAAYCRNHGRMSML